MKTRLLISGLAFMWLMVQVDDLRCQSSDLRQLIESGRAAYEKSEFESALGYFRQADEQRPNHPMITRLLVRLNSLTNRKDDAFANLEKLRLIDADVDFLLHEDLQVIQGDDRFKGIQSSFDAMNSVEGSFDTAAVITIRRLHPESVAILPNEQGLLVGSVHEKRIVKITQDGELQDWISAGEHGLYSVMGMAIDAKRNLLWVASTAIPQMVWYEEEMDGKAAVFAFDLSTKALVKKFEPVGSGKYWFGDLTLDDEGNVFVSNSLTPEILKISSVEGEIEQWKTFGDLVSLQGLAAMDGELFFADYLKGVFRTQISDPSNAYSQVNSPEGTILKGIDGLYATNDGLISIQNGVYPNRISLWKLNGDKSAFDSMVYIDKANPAFGEPTLGYVDGDMFYYIANSQWSGYYPDGRIFEDEKLKDTYVFKAPIPSN
ncbi:MAG: hypothetical protein AAGC88_08160 [Bacteroidota bacterium]